MDKINALHTIEINLSQIKKALTQVLKSSNKDLSIDDLVILKEKEIAISVLLNDMNGQVEIAKKRSTKALTQARASRKKDMTTGHSLEEAQDGLIRLMNTLTEMEEEEDSSEENISKQKPSKASSRKEKDEPRSE